MKFNKDLINSFLVIMLTDKQTNTGEEITSSAKENTNCVFTHHSRDLRTERASAAVRTVCSQMYCQRSRYHWQPGVIWTDAGRRPEMRQQIASHTHVPSYVYTKVYSTCTETWHTTIPVILYKLWISTLHTM